jgi:flagellar hook assembly protein FlgD
MLDNVGVYSDGGSPNDENTIPVVKTELKGNYPNPFNPETTIRFSVKEAGPVSVEIYNLKGQLVKRLVNEEKTAGEHSVVWNGTDNNNRPVSSGVYFYRMNAGKYSSSKKMIMMK